MRRLLETQMPASSSKLHDYFIIPLVIKLLLFASAALKRSRAKGVAPEMVWFGLVLQNVDPQRWLSEQPCSLT